MTAVNNGQYKQGWITGYYPYGQYAIVGDRMVFSGDEIEVENSILTRKVVENSNSGFDNKGQIGGRRIKQFRLKSKSISGALRELEGKVDEWVRGGGSFGGGLLMLSVDSLGDKKSFVKIYGKKNM